MEINTHYILRNMAASTKIMLGDLNGLNEIDHSSSSFWRSFLALMLAVPFAMSRIYSEQYQIANSGKTDQTASLLSILFIQETASLLAYFLSLVVLYAICKSMGLIGSFPLSIISLNWASLTMTVLTFPVLVFMGMMDSRNAVLPFLVLLLMVVFSVAMFNVLRLAMHIPSTSAIVYVFVLTVFEIVCYFTLLDVAGF